MTVHRNQVHCDLLITKTVSPT